MKLSVFVVTYNQENYISQCLDSILAQKVDFEYEVIIGEDCSTDQTPQICDSYARKYPFIKVYHHKSNLGLVKNWEFVINHCSGDYVAMIEGDDFWIDNQKIKTQVDYLDNNKDCTLVFSNVEVVYDKINVENEGLFSQLEDRDYSIHEIMDEWNILSSSVVYRNIIKPIRYPKELFITDMYTFLLLMEKGRAHCINKKLVAYRRHGDNVSMIDSVAVGCRYIKQYRYFYKRFPAIKNSLQKILDVYLKDVIYAPYFPGIWKYRLYYMSLHPRLFLSRFALSTFISYTALRHK